jgi:hypothetical protein
MRRITSGLGVIAVVLSVGVLHAGAATRSPTLSASANFDATGKITNQVPKGWISSSSYNESEGTFVLNFADGLFSKPPNCTVNSLNSKIQSAELHADAFPQPVSTYSDAVVIIDSLTPKKNANSLPASQIVCVGTP